MRRLFLKMLLVGVLASLVVTRANAYCDANELCGLVGYTVLDCTYVAGDFEGADFDGLVKLDNGMIFEFQEYNYAYAYRPAVVIFAREATLRNKTFRLYRLLIDDYLYDATRVR